MKVNIKRFPVHYKDGVIEKQFNPMPEYKTSGAAGMDLVANEYAIIFPGETKVVRTGIGIELPEGYEAQVRPRSGLSKNGVIAILGTIDSDYRGEIGAIIRNTTPSEIEVHIGDRIAQLVVNKIEQVELNEVEVLNDTARQDKGFGSTGVQA